MLLAAIISTPLAIFLGWLCGVVLNKAKGREMVTSFILGFFMNGVYQLIVLYGFGSVVPITNPKMVLSRGYGIRNVTNLEGIRKCLDSLLPFSIQGIDIPLATFIVIALFCTFVVWFRKTKLGQDMRAVGQDMDVARAAGIPVERTRLLSIVISTVLACYGQIIFLQNIGTMNTYNSHEQAGMFAIAALLVGGASVSKASIFNVFLGVVLFHLMFVVSPMAGKYLIGQAQLGEYFRVFVSYGIISLALVLHAWRRQKEKDRSRRGLRGTVAE
jgi:simple sugar transport system permease protein